MSTPIVLVLFTLVGALIGWLGGWFASKTRWQSASTEALAACRAKLAAASEALRAQNRSSDQQTEALADARQQLQTLNQTILDLKTKQAELETIISAERSAAAEKIELLEDIRSHMTTSYQLIAAEGLQQSTQKLGELARTTLASHLEAADKDMEGHGKALAQMIVPLETALKRYEQQIQTMEKARQNAYGSLSAQVTTLVESQRLLQQETGRLVEALRVPNIRGRWGELTLRRAVELAGLTRRCDFIEQASAQGTSGGLRPDMIVRLPGGRQIVVDAKVPLDAYLDAIEATDPDTAQARLRDHARQFQAHVQQLAQKAYWTQFQPAPEFVVMFIPVESFFSAAVDLDSQLIDRAIAKGVIPATPTTLIALLKSVALGWRQQDLAANSERIGALGKELYGRINRFVQQLNRVGQGLNRCVGDYNRMIGSLERRLLVTARKFEDLGLEAPHTESADPVSAIETSARSISEDTADDA